MEFLVTGRSKGNRGVAAVNLMDPSDFEGTGWEGDWWVGGSADPDGTTVVLSGSKSCEIANTEFGVWGGSDEAEGWGKFLFRTDTIPASFATILKVSDSTSGVLLEITIFSGAEIGVDGTAKTVSTLSVDTLYYIWWHYKKGTGSNAIREMWFSTTDSRPASGGNNHSEITNASPTTNIENMNIQSGASGTLHYFDDMELYDSDIWA